MKSLKNAIAKWEDLNHKQFSPIKTQAIGVFEMHLPISIQNLIRRLDPKGLLYKPEHDLDGGIVTGYTPDIYLQINSAGFWNFVGKVHDSGFVGMNYVVGVAINNPSGFIPVAYNAGYVSGTIDIGHRDDSWNLTGFDSRIADSWDAIYNSGSVTFNIKTSADPWSVLEDVVIGLFAVVGTGLFLLSTLSGAHCQDPQVNPVQDQHGGAGADVTTTCTK